MYFPFSNAQHKRSQPIHAQPSDPVTTHTPHVSLSNGELPYHTKRRASEATPRSQHHDANPAHVLLVGPVVLRDAAPNGRRLVVEQVVVQVPVAAAEVVLVEDQRVVHERQGVEDVELELLAEDEGLVHQLVQARLERRLVGGEGRLAGVVEEVGGAEELVLGVVDDGGVEAVEGEEVGDLAVVVLRRWLV